MNSLVCIAYVPDTESKIKIGADGKSIDEADVKFIVSPYDEYALEEALKIKESKGAGTVTVVALGPERAKTGLRECLARGADEAIWIDSTGVRLPRRARHREGARRRREGRGVRLLLVRPEGRGLRRGPRRPDVRRARGRAPRREHHQARGRRREDHGAPRDRGRPRGRGVPAAGGADGPEGPERAALRVAQGHHGGQEEDDRPRRSSPSSPCPRPIPRRRRSAGGSSTCRPHGRPSSSSRRTIRRRRARSWRGCCEKKRK